MQRLCPIDKENQKSLLRTHVRLNPCPKAIKRNIGYNENKTMFIVLRHVQTGKSVKHALQNISGCHFIYDLGPLVPRQISGK